MDRKPFRKMRGDREIGNTPGLPKAAIEGRRSDMTIDTLLKIHKVTSVEALKEKFRGNNTLKKFNQKQIK
tara:strand:+ start:654 stop:863 length:210 start_codon:yes stop_codon:yes gene_type:complete